MRAVFLGNAPWSVPSLEALADSPHEVALVITRSPRVAGRGNRPTPTPVAETARRRGLPLAEVETVKSGPGFEGLAEAAPDVLVVVAYGEIVPKPVLDTPRVAPVNLHFSRLPELRGAAPVQRAILDGLAVTGVTTIRMDEGMDTGPILLQAEETISAEDDTGSLGSRLATLGGRLLVETLDRLDEGTIEERMQDEERATYAPKLKPEDRLIQWETSEAAVLRRVRALSPEPSAQARFRDMLLKIHRASESTSPVQMAPNPTPGEIIEARKSLTVATAGRPVVLDQVQPEGRRPMSGADFVRGYRPEIGERLG